MVPMLVWSAFCGVMALVWQLALKMPRCLHTRQTDYLFLGSRTMCVFCWGWPLKVVVKGQGQVNSVPANTHCPLQKFYLVADKASHCSNG
jgi:hypothetical protein